MKIKNHLEKKIEGKINQLVIKVMEKKKKNQKKNLNLLLKVQIEQLILIKKIMKLK